jgi:hypothetical protein
MTKIVMVAVVVLGLTIYVWNQITSFKISGPITSVIGPFQCGNEDLKIIAVHSVNKLEGIASLRDITVTFGPAIVFRSHAAFKGELEAKNNKSYELFHEYEEDLDISQKYFLLPSQEELVNRDIRPDEKYRVVLATADASAEDKMSSFVSCFKQHKDAIYDTFKNKKTPQPIFFDKVYFLKL